MPKSLERDLGLYATITISIGAMVGSGIFVLPGLAAAKAGPAVVLSYLLAGLVVLPAALSKSEMATAMPEAGGTYLYIDRAMGPRLGTIAGIGAWFSLVFKSAFALVGLGAYLLLFVALPEGATVVVALALGVLLVVVNVVGVKQTGRLQAGIVTIVLLVLVAFIGDGLTYVDGARFHPFFTKGAGGVVAAAGFVFVSYAGVTKIASVAEEVENPGRNIPLGMLGSVLLMMLVYTFVVFVVVGVTPISTVGESLTPMAVAAGAFAGRFGEVVLSVVAVLALTSMANAGVLSSSRFPLAMSRDDLAPESLHAVHERFRTPVRAIVVTGGLLLLLIAFVPVVELAKLASAFKILLFSLINVALIAFRESDLESYDPEFVAPGYPWVQLAGLFSGLSLLTVMGAVSILGAVGIVVAGLLWYRVYGREQTEREGAALDAIRRSTLDTGLERLEAAFERPGGRHVLVPFGGESNPERDGQLLALAADAIPDHDGTLSAVRFEVVPEQLSLSDARASTAEDDAFERHVAAMGEDLPMPVAPGEVVSHDIKRAVANHVAETGVDLVVGEWHPDRLRAELLDIDVDWYMEQLPCDVLFVRNRGLGDVDHVVVATDSGLYDPLEVVTADAIATAHDATVEFLPVVEPAASDELRDLVEDYHAAIAERCRAETTHTLIRADDQVAAIAGASADADLAVVSAAPQPLLYSALFGSMADALAERLDCTVVLAHSDRTRRHTLLRSVLDRLAY